MPTDEDFLENEMHPPGAQRVAKRALVMSAVIHRAFVESNADVPEVKTECQKALDWLEQLDVWDELEPKEKEILNTPLGQLPPRQAIDSAWRIEGLAVLAWALHCFELPEYDRMIDSQAVATSLYFLNNEAEKLLTSPKLRANSELEQYAERMFALHWRLREYHLHPNKLDFQKFAQEAQFGPLDIGGLRFIDNDLAIGQSEISQTSDEEIWQCMSITNERHRAANWLIGYDELYSDVDVST